MWADLREELDIGLAQLRQLLTTFDGLMRQVERATPDAVETVALAGMLHSFYTGIENLFKRISIHVDGGAPRGNAWHSCLLDSMAQQRGNRSAIVSACLRDRLRPHLNFRHVFRQAYSFQLEWGKMAPLVRQCRDTLDMLDPEIGTFLDAAGPVS